MNSLRPHKGQMKSVLKCGTKVLKCLNNVLIVLLQFISDSLDHSWSSDDWRRLLVLGVAILSVRVTVDLQENTQERKIKLNNHFSGAATVTVEASALCATTTTVSVKFNFRGSLSVKWLFTAKEKTSRVIRSWEGEGQRGQKREETKGRRAS